MPSAHRNVEPGRSRPLNALFEKEVPLEDSALGREFRRIVLPAKPRNRVLDVGGQPRITPSGPQLFFAVSFSRPLKGKMPLPDFFRQAPVRAWSGVGRCLRLACTHVAHWRMWL